MKRLLFIIAVLGFILTSCGGETKKEAKKGFSPKERQSTLSETEREQAIAEKRAELNATVDLTELLNQRGVKFSILIPKMEGKDITEGIAERIAMKMLTIASQNGISGMGTSPGFVLGASIMQTGHAATSTAPQKMTVKYELIFKVMNTLTNDVYATTTQEVMGVGANFAEANINAVSNIKNTKEIQQMLQSASERIIEWYNTNLATVKNQVDAAANEGNYALALAMVESVPEAASEAFKYATEKQPELFEGLKKKTAKESFAAMNAALAAADTKFDPQIAAYLTMIPVDSPEYVQAKKAFDAYEKKCKDHISALEAKAAKDEAAARAYEIEKLKLTQQERLAQIEANKLKCKYEQAAIAKSMERAMRAETDSKKGFWGSLGDRVLGGIDAIGEAIDDLD